MSAPPRLPDCCHAIPPQPARRRHVADGAHTRWTIGALIGVMLLVGACRKVEQGPARATAIGVGAMPGAPGYTGIVRGIELAIERLAPDGVHLQTRLPRPGVTSAVQVAQQLQADPTVLAVIGHPESGRTLETLPIYADAEHAARDAVVLVSPTATSPQLTGASPWFFRVAPSDEEVARFAARWVGDSLQATRVAVVYRNDSYGRDWAAVFSAAFRRHGAVVASEPYLSGVVEWDAYAAQLAVERPDAVLFPGDADDAIAFRRALEQAGVRIPFVGGDGTDAMRNTSLPGRAWSVGFFDAAAVHGEEGARFLQRYRERFGEDPDYFAAQAYDAALVIGRTAARGAATRTSLRLALEAIGTRAPAIEGVSGPIGFTPKHDLRPRGLFVLAASAASP